MRPTVLMQATLAVLTGCTLAEKPALALACQTTTCACMPAQPSYPVAGDPAPVQWKSNGDAYCEDGYVLRQVNR